VGGNLFHHETFTFQDNFKLYLKNGKHQTEIITMSCPTTLDGLPMAVKRVVRDLTSHKAALEKAMALVERIEFIHADPLFRSVWFSAWNHGIDYTNGPKYDKELASLKEALTAIN